MVDGSQELFVDTRPLGIPTQALSVDQFCLAHGICRATFYGLLKTGRGPRLMKVGARTLVSVEAAAEWRRKMEDATAA